MKLLEKLFSGGYFAGGLLILMFILDVVGLTSQYKFGAGIIIILAYFITLGIYKNKTAIHASRYNKSGGS